MTVAACRRAAALGVDAVMVRTPGFYKTRITPESLLQYYTAVADASPAPVILYNITAFTGVNLLPETAAALSRHANVIGIKDSGGDISVISDLVAQCRPGFPVLAGATTMLYASLCVGGQGATVGPAPWRRRSARACRRRLTAAITPRPGGCRRCWCRSRSWWARNGVSPGSRSPSMRMA